MSQFAMQPSFLMPKKPICFSVSVLKSGPSMQTIKLITLIKCGK